MTVKNVAYGRSRCVGAGGHPWRARARAVKYMANRPAKNISSLDSQMIVPTLTMLGLVRECTLDVSKVLLTTGGVVTRLIMAPAGVHHDRGCGGRDGNVSSSSPTSLPVREMSWPGNALGGVSPA